MISPTDTVYPVLKENLNLYELNSCFLASEDEISFIENETRSTSSKLGFLIMLKTFQNLGYFIKIENVPKNIISFISSQLNIEQFDSILIDYDSSRNRLKQMDKILEFMSVKNYSDIGDQIVEKVAKNNALVRENLSDIINACIETLLHDRIELPAFSRLHREAMNQRAQVYNELYLRIFNDIGDNRRNIIDNLFIVDPLTRKSEWDNIKFEIGKPKPKEIKKLIKHIHSLNNIIEIESFFEGIPSIKIEQMAVEAEYLDASDMQRVEAHKRYSLAIALIKIKKSKSVDSLIDIFLKQMSSIFYLAKEELDKYLKENQDKTDEIMKKFISVEDVVKDGLTNGEKVELISNIYQENISLSTYARTHCEYGGKQHIRFMAKFFKKKRKLIFRILESLKFFSATQDEGITRSLEFMIAHKRSRKPIIETFAKSKKRSDLILMDVKWIEQKWWKLVTSQKKRESFPETVRREHFEVCLCDALSMSLRCGDIYVLGSLDYNDYRKELLPLSECEKTVAKYGEIVNLPVEKEAFISHVKKLLILKSEETDIKFPDNTDFTFKDGSFHLKRLIARTSTQRNEDDDIFQGRINELKLIDALTDTAHWISWHKVFGPHSGHQAKIKDELSRYVAMTFSYGTGLGPKEGSKMLFGFSADQIADTDKNHSTCEKIDRAIFKVIEAYNKLHLPRAAWGTGKNIGADGSHWNLSEHNSFSQRHIRYGQWGGIAYYHVADNYIAIFSKFIPCGVYEAVHILDGVFSQLKQDRPDFLHGDTHAQNSVVFGLSFLLGIKLMPRIRTWQDLKLYKASKEYSYKHIEDLFTNDNINWEIIQKHLPDMLQVAQSIMAGVIKPSTILRRLGSTNQKSKLFQAFNMLGRVIRTITLLEYVSDKELRHIVQGATSKCEQFNKFAKWLHFAQDFIKQNKRDEQQKIIKYNHLIAVLLTFHNAYSMTEALVEIEKEGIKIPAETISSLSPYRTRHVRRFGEFQVSEEATKILDLNLKPFVTDELLRKATVRN